MEIKHKNLGGIKMKRCVMILIFLLAFTLTFSSLGLATEEYITIAGGSVGGSWFPVASAIAELLNKELGESITSAKPGGGVSNPIMVSQGKVSAGFSYSSFLVVAKNAEDPYKEKLTNLRSIAMLFPMYFQIIGDEDLPYDSLGEFIKNKYPLKMCPTKPGHGDFWVTQKAFTALGATFDDINDWRGKVEFGGGGEAASLYKDRHIDMIFAHNVIPLSSFSDVAVSRKSKLMKIDNLIIEELKEKYGMQEGIIPANTYKGTDIDIKTVGMPCVFFVREDISDDIVYAMTKVVCENSEYLSSINKLFKTFDPTTAWKDLGVELHPGAEKYYREKGYMK